MFVGARGAGPEKNIYVLLLYVVLLFLGGGNGPQDKVLKFINRGVIYYLKGSVTLVSGQAITVGIHGV